jgi:hypothetical protein
MAKRHLIPKKYIKPLLEELIRDKERKEHLFQDLKSIIEPIEVLKKHMILMSDRLTELREFAKDDEYLLITRSIGIYAYFGWLVVGLNSVLEQFKDLEHEEEFLFIAETLVEILRKQGIPRSRL